MLQRALSGGGGGNGDFDINNAKHLHFNIPPSDGYIELGTAPQFLIWTVDVSGSYRAGCWNGYNSSKWYRRQESGSITEYNINQTTASGALKSIDSTGFTINGAEYCTQLDVYAVI